MSHIHNYVFIYNSLSMEHRNHGDVSCRPVTARLIPGSACMCEDSQTSKNMPRRTRQLICLVSMPRHQPYCDVFHLDVLSQHACCNDPLCRGNFVCLETRHQVPLTGHHPLHSACHSGATAPRSVYEHLTEPVVRYSPLLYLLHH